ncbi:MAG: acyl-CoA dehydrogenase [Actinobacteria bacterium]|nr:MAG: acyl-CoA dehydrogenase [Actinomycetota bacterium]
MDFTFGPKVLALEERLLRFMDDHVFPAEPVYRRQVEEAGDPYVHPPVMEELKRQARAAGLWNLFLPDPHWGAGLTTLEYAPLAEISGRSLIAPESLNCSAPDTGNMEILAEQGTPEQQERWLKPLLEGEIRSCFAMTEPDVASSDATNIQTRIERKSGQYVVNGRKWWISGAGMVLVPMDARGVIVVRPLPVFGYEQDGGHCEILFEEVGIPTDSLLGDEGRGFAIAQSRLGPGRIHHCMRAVGMAERAFDLMCRRALSRVAFGKRLADQGVVQDWVAESRMDIEQARLMVLKAAWLMDTAGKDRARLEISAIKVIAARAAIRVIDRAIQLHGGAGVSADVPLAEMYAHARALRIVDGPDDVHKMLIARRELARYGAAAG